MQMIVFIISTLLWVFNHPDVFDILSRIDSDKLLLIDSKPAFKNVKNYVFQDFGQAFYSCLEKALHLFKKYEVLDFVLPRIYASSA